MAQGTKKSKRPMFYANYATLKARGVEDKTYTVTIHKMPVRIAAEKEREPVAAISLDADVITADNDTIDNVSKADADNKKSDEKSKERFMQSVIRSRSAVVQLGANNPWEYFVTLTLTRTAECFNAYDLESVKKVLLEFLSNYARRSGKDTGFKYLLIPEMHKDGAWHFHGLLMGINPNDLFVNEHGYLDFKPFRDRFGWVSFGSTKSDNDAALGDSMSMGRIRDLARTASYITKYITKDMFGANTDAQNSAKHLYFASKGLKKDELIKKGECLYQIEDFKYAGYEVQENEYCAKVTVPLEVGEGAIEKFASDTREYWEGVYQIEGKRLKDMRSFRFVMSRLFWKPQNYEQQQLDSIG